MNNSNTPPNASANTSIDQRRRGRGIYLLPNLFTSSALLAGFYALIAAYGGEYRTAGIAIIVAMVLDGFDGRVARMTNTTTAFGAEYDSMADMVSFGVAPSFLMYTWSLESLPVESYGQLGWAACFVYTGCCALRLARFNVQVGVADKRFFQGLACPAAAAVLASLVWVCEEVGVKGPDIVWLVFILTLAIGLFMVSTFMYYSFKDLGDSKKIPFAMLFGFLMLLVVTAVDPAKMILVASLGYAIAGPAYALFRWVRKRNKRAMHKP